MNDNHNNPYLTVREAGAYVLLAKRTFDNIRWMGTGPMFRKQGGRIYYRVEDLKEWSLESRCKLTSVLNQSVVAALLRPLTNTLFWDDPEFSPFPAFPNRVSRRFVITWHERLPRVRLIT
jgi:hypothetical protein